MVVYFETIVSTYSFSRDERLSMALKLSARTRRKVAPTRIFVFRKEVFPLRLCSVGVMGIEL
jgi:hypothetical protein